MSNIGGIDPGVTASAFAVIFGAGWTACYTFVVRPMKADMDSLRSKVDQIEKDKDDRIRKMEQKLGIWTD